MFRDVSTPAWVASLFVLGICAWIAIADVRRWQERQPVRVGIKRLFLWACAAVFVFWLAQDWSNASSSPHATTSGAVTPVQKALYHGDREGMIACVQDCKEVLLNFDPDATKVHKGPAGGGHKGDLPKLEVSEKGTSSAKLKAAGLKLADVEGKALMIHEGGDNYADAPKPLGGGGARIACGVVPAAKADK